MKENRSIGLFNELGKFVIGININHVVSKPRMIFHLIVRFSLFRTNTHIFLREKRVRVGLYAFCVMNKLNLEKNIRVYTQINPLWNHSDTMQ